MVSARAMFSRTVNVSSRFESWKTNPSSSRRKRESSLEESVVISRPATRMEPLVTTSIVDMQFKSVDLPEPDGPMIPTNSPSSTKKLTPARPSVASSSPRFALP